MNLILLTDSDNGTALIACGDDSDLADRIAEAGVWNDGDVSAWMVPSTALRGSDEIVRILTEGGDCGDLAILDTAANQVELTITADDA